MDVIKTLIIFIVFIVGKGQYCQNTFKSSSLDCEFSYGYKDQSCSNFIFYKCSYQICAQTETQVTTGPYGSRTSSTSCVRSWTQAQYRWDNCINRCCDNSKQYAYSASSFQQCEDDVRKKRISTILIIVFSIVGGVSIIVIIICCCCKGYDKCCKDTRECCQSICSPCIALCKCLCKKTNQKQGNPQNQIEEKEMEFQNSLSQKWTKFVTNKYIINQSCSICFFGRPNIQLSCTHFYHKQCIKTWLKTNRCCPSCQKTDLGLVKIYCQNCFEFYFQTTLIRAQNQQINVCSSCKQQEMKTNNRLLIRE